MQDNEKIFTALGQMQESIKNIKENTDKISDIFVDLAVAKEDIKYMKPKVERHQRIAWIGSGIMAVLSIGWSFMLANISGGHK